MDQMKELQKKEIKMQELQSLKMQEMSKIESELLLEMVAQIRDLNILMGQVALKITSVEFGGCFPAGNQIRSFMKVVEKMSYV